MLRTNMSFAEPLVLLCFDFKQYLKLRSGVAPFVVSTTCKAIPSLTSGRSGFADAINSQQAMAPIPSTSSSSTTANASDILRMHGASSADKSAAPVPNVVRNLLQELIEDDALMKEDAAQAKRSKKQTAKAIQFDAAAAIVQAALPNFENVPIARSPAIEEAHRLLQKSLDYDVEHKAWEGTAAEWQKSELRMQCVKAMSRTEVGRRRFQPHRPDILKSVEGKWVFQKQ